MDERKGYADFGFKNLPQSYWIASTETTNYPAVDKDIKVDAVIVGGGIVGITTALLLKKENLKVAVVEAKRIVERTTGHNTAKVTSQHNIVYSKMIKNMGREKAQQYAEANEYAISFIEDMINKKNIECDFSRQDAYIYTQFDKHIKLIEEEVEAASSLGIKASYLDEIPLDFNIKAAERFENQAQFHPRKYLLELAKEIPGDGSYIFEKTRAVDFNEGTPCSVTTENGFKVTADKMIIASHFPVYESSGFYSARLLNPGKTYALGIKAKERFPGGMYISVEEPGRFLRSTPYEEGELIIISGEHHQTGQDHNTNIHYKNLADYAQKAYDSPEILFRWSDQDFSTLDDAPYVGNITSKSPNTYVATGFKKWGMTNGTASAILLRDLIVKGESPWAPVYNPSRFEVEPMMKNFVSSNFDTAKHFIGDKLKAASKDKDIDPGEAKIIFYDNKKLGVYKDENGEIFAVDIVCSHMGCNLTWNAAELSWDCPCHGSRFTYKGDIIEGGALKPLKTYNINLDKS